MRLVCSTPVVIFLSWSFSDAYAPIVSPFRRIPTRAAHWRATVNDNSDDAFSAFAESLDEEAVLGNGETDDMEVEPTWQESLELLLDPNTPLPKRQILLSDLLNANEEIRGSVQDALRERKIDPLLTPTGKKLQDGTRAVARQITNDILPGIAEVVSTTTTSGPADIQSRDLPTLLPKLGSRIFNAFSNQARKQIETLRDDLADPTRIPERISKQAADVAAEAKNVFLETPENLSGPSYTVVSSGAGYEIRQYEGYTVASTSMAKVGEPYSADDIASGGAAFNALAAYLFGANDEGKTMEMTTPVTTTSLGEMRFYLKQDGISMTPFPTPQNDKDDAFFNQVGEVEIVQIPPALLAVARFTGFVTEGEVSRQKDALLAALDTDGIAVDVPHGSIVPHVIFQYNPPYTIPIVRRNEIAVPVRPEGQSVSPDLESEWGGDDTDDDLAPSDVE